MRLAIRGFVDGRLKFEDALEVDGSGMESLVPRLAEKHAAMMAAGELDMIEIEFLDEPDPLQRFFRFGTNPRAMVLPVSIHL